VTEGTFVIQENVYTDALRVGRRSGGKNWLDMGSTPRHARM